MFRRPSEILCAVSLLAIAFAASPASASEYSKQAKSGEKTLLYRFYDCTRHVPGGQAGATAANGTVTIEDTHLNKCGNPQEPARLVWYTSNPGFKGMDTVTFPAGRGGNSMIFDVTVH